MIARQNAPSGYVWLRTDVMKDDEGFLDHARKLHFKEKKQFASKKAKNFQKVAKNCTCTFECANAINTVYDPKHWMALL